MIASSHDFKHNEEREASVLSQITDAAPKTAREVFARLLRVLEPYASDIVLIGGWVHALYLAESAKNGAGGGPPILTDDVDVTVPRTLIAGKRRPLVDLVAEIGFERDPLSDMEGATILLRQIVGNTIVDLDILTEVDSPGTSVAIEGQPGLLVSGYPGQSILLENAQWMTVGVALHETLDPPVSVRVPTLSAYVFHKGLSSLQRVTSHKRAKDIVYMAEILRHPVLGPIASRDLRTIAVRYPMFHSQWEQYLSGLRSNQILLRDVAEQLLIANRATGTVAEVGAAVARRVERLLLLAGGAIA